MSGVSNAFPVSVGMNLASFLARVAGGGGTSMDGGGGGGGGIVGVDFVFKFGCLPVVNVSPAVVTELPSTETLALTRRGPS